MNILVIDDERSICDAVCIGLKHEGHNVYGIYSSREFDVDDANKYDLLILDIMMPGKDGFQLCCDIREKSNIPILFLTAKNREEDVIQGFMCGADDYICKPFSMKELILRVNAVLRRCKKELNDESGNIIFNDLKVNKKMGMVEYKNKEILLTKTEYKLLLLFLENPDQLIEKETIYEALWNICSDIRGDDSINTHMKNLRKKIEDTNIRIKTVWGRGYRIEIK